MKTKSPLNMTTCTAVHQRGAQIFITLQGDRDAVREEAYRLYNHGLAVLPDTYDERDTVVTLASNMYRLEKFIAASKEIKMIERVGWQRIRAMRRTGEIRERAKEGVRGLVNRLRTSGERSIASTGTVYAYRDSGREIGTRWDVSPGMASVRDHAERVSAAHEFASSK